MNIPVPNLKLIIAIVSNATSGGGAEKSMMALHEEFLRAGLESNFVALNKNLPINDVPKVTVLNRRWKSGVRATVNNYFDFKKTIRSIDPQILILNCELPELFGSLINFNGQIICVELKKCAGLQLLKIIKKFGSERTQSHISLIHMCQYQKLIIFYSNLLL